MSSASTQHAHILEHLIKVSRDLTYQLQVTNESMERSGNSYWTLVGLESS